VRTLRIVAAVALVATAASVPALRAAEPPVRVAGFMPFGFDERVPHKMAVDSVLHRGYYVTRVPTSRLWVYDLERLRSVATVTTDIPGGPFAVDEVHHRVFYAPSQPPANCRDSFIWILDQRKLSFAQNAVPCDTTGTGFFVRGLSYYAPADKLLVVGEGSVGAVATQVSGSSNAREPMVIRQMSAVADTFDVDWEINLSTACDAQTNIPTDPEPVVARTARGVVSYCYVNGQGRAVWIPVRDGKPVSDAVVVSPTVGRSTAPVIDGASGRLLILADTPPFGPAVYVFEPELERFAAVIPSGVPPKQDNTFYDYWRGLDPVNGRLYLLNQAGLVSAQVRADPIPPAVSHPVLTKGVNQIFSGPVSIDGRLHRLFFAYPKRGGFVVVEDHQPAVRSPAADPDAGTADVAERAGVTGRTFSAAAHAAGVRVVNTGGLPRAVDNADVACTAESEQVNDRDAFGRCPADRALTPGHRETSFGESSLQSGSDTGTVASAAAHATPSSDEATDTDLRRAGRCYADATADAGAAASVPCPNGRGQALEPLTSGARGADGKGYPVRRAECLDFTGTPSKDAAAAPPSLSASASCDDAGHAASASSSAPAVDTTLGPIAVTVAKASSSVSTKLTDGGVETVASATARGVDISGVVSIGTITSTARTITHGRTGTARTEHTLDVANARGPGMACVSCDPAAVASAINRALGAQFRARVPQAYELATPRGYAAVVSKEPGLRASDRAINDDDAVTVDGLDVIFYNDSTPTNRDGSAGRSRVILSLAGVHAESRYGIFRLPSPVLGGSGGILAPVVAGDTLSAPVALRSLVAPPVVDVARPAAARELTVERAIRGGWRFVAQNPREFGMLALLWTILAAPVYLALRRRARERQLAA
jgi:hypothetical protein